MMLAITKLVETIERLLFPRRRERGSSGSRNRKPQHPAPTARSA